MAESDESLIEGLDDRTIGLHFVYATAVILRELHGHMAAMEPDLVFDRHSEDEVFEAASALLAVDLSGVEFRESLLIAMIAAGRLQVSVTFE